MKIQMKLTALALALAAGLGADGAQIEVKGWAPPVGGTSGYNLYMSAEAGKGYRKINTEPVTLTAYTVTGLTAGELYYFKLTALNHDQPPRESAPTGEFAMLASDPSGAPAAPVPILAFYEPVGGEASMVYDPAKALLKIIGITKSELAKDGNSVILHLRDQDAAKLSSAIHDHRGGRLLIVSGDGKEVAWTAAEQSAKGTFVVAWPQLEILAAYLRARFGLVPTGH